MKRTVEYEFHDGVPEAVVDEWVGNLARGAEAWLQHCGLERAQVVPAIELERAKLLEHWVMIDRWWTDEPIRREYVEVEILSTRVVLVRGPDQGCLLPPSFAREKPLQEEAS